MQFWCLAVKRCQENFLWKLCSVQSPNSFDKKKNKICPDLNLLNTAVCHEIHAKIGITLSLNTYPGCSFSQTVSVESLTVDQCFWIFIDALKGVLKGNALFPRASHGLIHLEGFYKVVFLLFCLCYYLKDLLGLSWCTLFFPICPHY